MKQVLLAVKENTALTENVFKMKLDGDLSDITLPGQFVNIKIDNFYLRRPISVCDLDDNILTLIYKVVGKGTEAMSKMSTGTVLDVLMGLGNGYDLELCGDSPLLLGGGVGVPPMYLLAKRLIKSGKKVTVILGIKPENYGDLFA